MTSFGTIKILSDLPLGNQMVTLKKLVNNTLYNYKRSQLSHGFSHLAHLCFQNDSRIIQLTACFFLRFLGIVVMSKTGSCAFEGMAAVYHLEVKMAHLSS